MRGLWRRRDVHGARQLSAAALEVRGHLALALLDVDTPLPGVGQAVRAP